MFEFDEQQHALSCAWLVQVTFIPKVPRHPHCYSNGHICLDMLYGGWGLLGHCDAADAKLRGCLQLRLLPLLKPCIWMTAILLPPVLVT
jgi:hypothetical protein